MSYHSSALPSEVATTSFVMFFRSVVAAIFVGDSIGVDSLWLH